MDRNICVTAGQRAALMPYLRQNRMRGTRVSPNTPANLARARAHFADHCAICHANNGSGNTDIGRNLYPKAPDMRLPQTQNLTDGELYYTIHNGIRLTGMPAWGSAEKDEDSWELVLFIHNLPQLTPAGQCKRWDR